MRCITNEPASFRRTTVEGSCMLKKIIDGAGLTILLFLAYLAGTALIVVLLPTLADR